MSDTAIDQPGGMPLPPPDSEGGPPAIEAVGLEKRYRRGFALKDCSFRLPAGRICALIGPNGAGKSTLMSLAANLLDPSGGTVRLFGDAPSSARARRWTSFLSQDKPLYKGFRVAEILRMGQELNPAWDQAVAERIVAQGGVPLSAKVGTLSGGQRTRVAFALAFGKRPRLLLLDEPLADLDPLVRRQTMDTLMSEVALNGTTVVLSSHLIAELQNACDYVLLLNKGSVRLAGGVNEILGAHRVLAGAGRLAAEQAGHIVLENGTSRGTNTTLVRPTSPLPMNWMESKPDLEELLLAYLSAPDAPALITSGARSGPEEVPA